MMSSTRRLVMEDLGFDPKNTFTEEQISKMRSMKAVGSLGSFGKCKFGTIFDNTDFQSIYKRERNPKCL